MADRCIFFAGGGTGGHIYPAVAIAQALRRLDKSVNVRFFCSRRRLDRAILTPAGFEFFPLPAEGFSPVPNRFVRFAWTFFLSFLQARRHLKIGKATVVTGTGGFVAAPACLAARSLSIPVVLINVDSVAGRASGLIARWAKRIYVQFESTVKCFDNRRAAVVVAGCPLRQDFSSAGGSVEPEELESAPDKKILLITGASSGAESINQAICLLIPKFEAFADGWQIVHITGDAGFQPVRQAYEHAGIRHKVLAYCHQMPDLLSSAGLVIGRSGAVSVAEYAAAGVPSICIPYPHHADRHQYLNARALEEAGAAVIVEDVADKQQMAESLWQKLEPLMRDNERRQVMSNACAKVARPGAAELIAKDLLWG